MATDIKIMLSYCRDRASAVAEQQDCPKTDALRDKTGEAITDGQDARPYAEALCSRILLCIFSSEFFEGVGNAMFGLPNLSTSLAKSFLERKVPKTSSHKLTTRLSG